MDQNKKETSSVENELRQSILAIEQENVDIATKIQQVSYYCTDELVKVQKSDQTGD